MSIAANRNHNCFTLSRMLMLKVALQLQQLQILDWSTSMATPMTILAFSTLPRLIAKTRRKQASFCNNLV
jgi:hypothetical protein